MAGWLDPLGGGRARVPAGLRKPLFASHGEFQPGPELAFQKYLEYFLPPSHANILHANLLWARKKKTKQKLYKKSDTIVIKKCGSNLPEDEAAHQRHWRKGQRRPSGSPFLHSKLVLAHWTHCSMSAQCRAATENEYIYMCRLVTFSQKCALEPKFCRCFCMILHALWQGQKSPKILQKKFPGMQKDKTGCTLCWSYDIFRTHGITCNIWFLYSILENGWWSS